jgi:SAM-dependent methyltransferase
MAPLATTPLHPQWLVLRGGKETHRAIEQVARGVVLDIGCGDRWVEGALSPDTHYVGLDFPTTVEKGYAGRPDVFGDGQSLPFGDGSVDTVLLMDVLEHLPEPEGAMAEAQRVLKSGGILVVQVPFLYPLHDEPHDFRRWTLHGLRSLFDRHGFKIRDTACQGQPVETAAALLSISLAKGAVDAVAKKRLSILLAPFLILAIPLVNLTGWLMARILPDSSMMPLGYRVVAIKN